jgi:predicted PurR-regulated permease PerM
VRLAGKGGAVEKLQEMLAGIKTDLETSEAPTGTVLRPLVVASDQVTGFLGFAWLGPVVGPLSTAGFVAAMVIFMLLERRDLRDRLRRSLSSSAKPRVNRQQARKVWTSPWHTMDP